MAKGLTKRQQAILQFISQCIRDHGMPPTISQIGSQVPSDNPCTIVGGN